jgi:hypothetical protein
MLVLAYNKLAFTLPKGTALLESNRSVGEGLANTGATVIRSPFFVFR